MIVPFRGPDIETTGAGILEPTKGGSVRAIPLDQGIVGDTTVRQVRAMVDQHDLGVFNLSSMLMEWCLRDPDMMGALTQRLRRLLSWPLVVENGDGGAAASEFASTVKRAWPVVCSRQATMELEAGAALMGFAVFQVVMVWSDDVGELVPSVQPFPAYSVEWRRWERLWYVHTRDGGVFPIYPGDGRWGVYAPGSVNRPWTWGVIRALALWCLRSEYSARDASRLSEVHGVPVWLASIPTGDVNSPVGLAFQRSLRGMGRNAVVPLPKGNDDASSYGLKLEQPAVDTFRIFEWIDRAAAGKKRLAILGQDLTSQNAATGARATSETGDDVTEDVVMSDAETLADCLRDQVIVPWGAFRGSGGLAVRVVHRKDPERDRVRRAQALLTHGQALAAWQAAGAVVDVASEAEKAGIKITGTQEPRAVVSSAPMAPTSPESPVSP